jgi:HTTM domain
MKSRSRTAEASLFAQIRRFFHGEETPFNLALVRIFLPLALLVPMVPRWFRARELFSTDGATTPLWNGYGWPNLLPEVPGTVAVIFMTVLLLTLVTASIGWCTRLSLVISFLLYTYVNLVDAISTMTKYSVIASHVLLILSMSQCGLVWSVDSWLRKRKLRRVTEAGGFRAKAPGTEAGSFGNVAGFGPPRVPMWPRRLLQFLIGFVYFGAAITKLHTPAYFSGDQLLTWMLTNVNYSNPFGEYLSLFPAALVLIAYITVVWEILFVFLAWRGWGRTCILTIGVVFHVMTTLTLGLIVFPMVCLSIYFAFLNERDLLRISIACRRVWRRVAGRSRARAGRRAAAAPAFAPPPKSRAFPVPSPAVFAALLAVVAIVGVETEYRLDPYGERRPEGPYVLKQLDTEFVEHELLAEPVPIRPEDVVHNLDAGTIVVGGQLLDARKEFRQGEILTAQATLNSPHEDMWVECVLRDDGDNELASKPATIPREMLRTSFTFPLSDALEPGTYYLVLKCAGRDVIRRTFSLRPRADRQAAN